MGCSHVHSLLPLLLLFSLAILQVSAHKDEKKPCPYSSAKGHMKPFGRHTRKWLRVESRYDEISAEEFYDQYVRPSKPVVIRGGTADWPAVKLWPNLTYLAEISGDTILSANWHRVHTDHEFMRSHHVNRPVTMKEYISRMNSENIYMDTPPTAPLLKEMMWPQVTNCEYFIHRMRAPSLFFNNGKSNTDIHIDGCETLFFQVSGSRLWLMTPPDNAPHMYSGEQFFPPHMGISAVNQHAVNLTLFPNISKSVLFAAVVHPGDLVYVPEAWFHNVMAHGNPNIATTIFFDSSNCEKVYAESPDAEYVQACDKHRRIFLPRSIECKKKLPRGTTFYDVGELYGKVNPKLLPSPGHGSHKWRMAQMQRLKKSKLWTQKLWDKSTLPRMVLDGEMESIIKSLPNKSESIMQLNFDFFHPRLDDIRPLAEHLTRFAVPRADFALMLTLPHEVSAAGADAANAWLDDALARFRPYPALGALDLLLVEAPACVPASPEAQECVREGAIDDNRLAAWRAMAARRAAGAVRHLGVKDVSAAELAAVRTEAEAGGERIAVVSLRFDPLYRQPQLRAAVKKAGAVVMAHSVAGSGWVRDGVTAENPLFDQQDFLYQVFSQTSSAYAAIYEWALKKGLLVMPERTGRAAEAQISSDALSGIGLNGFQRDMNKLLEKAKWTPVKSAWGYPRT